MRARIGKQQNLTRIAIRLPKKLLKDLAGMAAADNRSLNYEIILRLETSVEVNKILRTENINEALARLEKLRARLIDLRLPDEQPQDKRTA
jgi:hypothetical protein